VAQVMREIADSHRLREIVDCVTDHEGGRLLTVAQVMREIVDFVTDHEGNCCLYHS